MTSESRAVYEKQVVPFLKQHCWKCHDDKSAKAGFQLDTLGTDFLEGKTADHWHEAINLISLNKMPPKKEKRPDPAAAFVVVDWVNAELRNAEKRSKSGSGRVPMRRLNRSEYTNTVRDLFHLDEEFARKLERELPADGKVDGFDRAGAALYIDRSQLETYVEAARTVVDEALPPEKLKENRYRHEAIKDHNLLHEIRPTTTMKEVMERAQQLTNIYSKTPVPEFKPIPRGPELSDFYKVRDKGVETWLGPDYTGNWLVYFQRNDMAQRVVTRDGWYRVRVRAGADRGAVAYAVDNVKIDVKYCPEAREYASHFNFIIDAPLEKPKVYEKLVYLRVGPPSLERSIHFTWNIYYPAQGHHSPVQQDKAVSDLMHEASRVGSDYEEAKVKKKPAAVIEAARVKRDATYEKIRAFALEFKGPVYHFDPAVDHAKLPRLWHEFVDLEGPVTRDWPTKAAQEVFPAGEIKGDDASLRDVFSRFLPRAYRRAATADEVNDLVQVVHTMRDQHGKNVAEAVRGALRTALTSPSFCSWKSRPIPTAAPGPSATRRWRAGCRSSCGVRCRTPSCSNWPPRRRCTGPTCSLARSNGCSGTRKPGSSWIISWASGCGCATSATSWGDEFRRVPVKPAQHRGGILGMAGLLTYLSDGSRTQPVKRGAYVLDVLWNTPAPLPPPNAGDLPIVKDKNLTVRQRLEVHRSVATCASCHARIDPLGLALENYDAIGAWRERKNGEGHRGEQHDPLIDASGVLPDGRAFTTVAEFKHALLETKAKFLKGFTEKLLTYALGRPVGAIDRETVATIMAEAAKQDNRLQALLAAVAATPAFHSK